MKKILMVVLALSLVACATAPVIVPDKPQPNQCFEGPFNVFRLQQEKWQAIASDGNLLFFLKNPVREAKPEIVATILHPMNGGVVRYGYLDGKKFRPFTFDPASKCYKEDTLDQKTSDEMKALILSLLKESQI